MDGQYYDHEELIERRNAELEFINSAYNKDEAWYDENSSSEESIIVYRRLKPTNSSDEVTNSTTSDALSLHINEAISFVILLILPEYYPLEGCIHIKGRVEESDSKIIIDKKDKIILTKLAEESLNELIQSCQNIANDMSSQEAIFTIFNYADEWLIDVWTNVINSHQKQQQHHSKQNIVNDSNNNNIIIIQLCRTLIYSHHIIGKEKRYDMIHLSSELQLSGFLKIGWPGIIIIEGIKESCQEFYNIIRRWQWQYLVVRGEIIEDISLLNNVSSLKDFIDTKRLFPKLVEIDDMSIVANHCRQVGLESLFLTSMKVYSNTDDENLDTEASSTSSSSYGTLIHVDHMNDGKSYRKWLRNTCNEHNVTLLLKQCNPNQDYTNNSNKKSSIIIIVGLIGTIDSVSIVLKKWRTNKVDVDSKGKLCYERMMKILIEGNINWNNHHYNTNQDDAITTNNNLTNNVDDLNSEGKLNTTKEKLIDLIETLVGGGTEWSNCITSLFQY